METAPEQMDMTLPVRWCIAALLAASGGAVLLAFAATTIDRSPPVGTVIGLLAASVLGAGVSGLATASLFGQPGRRGGLVAAAGAVAATLGGGLVVGAVFALLTGFGAALILGPVVVVMLIVRAPLVAAVWVICMMLVHYAALRMRENTR